MFEKISNNKMKMVMVLVLLFVGINSAVSAAAINSKVLEDKHFSEQTLEGEELMLVAHSSSEISDEEGGTTTVEAYRKLDEIDKEEGSGDNYYSKATTILNDYAYYNSIFTSIAAFVGAGYLTYDVFTSGSVKKRK